MWRGGEGSKRRSRACVICVSGAWGRVDIGGRGVVEVVVVVIVVGYIYYLDR